MQIGGLLLSVGWWIRPSAYAAFVVSTLTSISRYQLSCRAAYQRGPRALPLPCADIIAEIALTISPAANPIPMQRELPLPAVAVASAALQPQD